MEIHFNHFFHLLQIQWITEICWTAKTFFLTNQCNNIYIRETSANTLNAFISLDLLQRRDDIPRSWFLHDEIGFMKGICFTHCPFYICLSSPLSLFCLPLLFFPLQLPYPFLNITYCIYSHFLSFILYFWRETSSANIFRKIVTG